MTRIRVAGREGMTGESPRTYTELQRRLMKDPDRTTSGVSARVETPKQI